jgi:hypothetical protein
LVNKNQSSSKTARAAEIFDFFFVFLGRAKAGLDKDRDWGIKGEESLPEPDPLPMKYPNTQCPLCFQQL